MLQLARFVGDQGRETMARAWLGILLAASGDHNAAIAYGKDALAMALSRGDRRSELYAQLALTDAYTGVPYRESEARYHANQALAVTAAIRHDRGEIECRLRFARLAALTEEWEEAHEAATRALTLAQRLGARHLESLARCWLSVGTQEENSASNHPNTALELAQAIGLTEGIWRANDLLASATLRINPTNSLEAEAHLHEATSTLDSLRGALVEAGLPDTLLENEDYVAVYGRLARLLRQNGRGEEANAFLEQTGWPPLTAGLAAARDTATQTPR